MKKLSKTASERIKRAPEMTMEELEKEEEDNMIYVSKCEEEKKKEPSIGWFFGYVAGLMTMVIVCGLTHNKTWKRL